jgi:hypothetical protein
VCGCGILGNDALHCCDMHVAATESLDSFMRF